jgi:hypothetical protein
MEKYSFSACSLGRCRAGTYADCGEDILKLVDKCDEARVVHVDPITITP